MIVTPFLSSPCLSQSQTGFERALFGAEPQPKLKLVHFKRTKNVYRCSFAIRAVRNIVDNLTKQSSTCNLCAKCGR